MGNGYASNLQFPSFSQLVKIHAKTNAVCHKKFCANIRKTLNGT
jgi:hypothetical protein